MGLFNIFKKKTKEIDIHLLEQQTDQKIFNILQKYLPDGWLEVVFFAGYYKDDSGYFKYWIKLENEKYIDCFHFIPEPKAGEKDILQDQLMEIHNALKFVRLKLSDKHRWVCMKMSVNNKGELLKNYDYADGVAKENLKQYVVEYKDILNEKYASRA